MSTLPPTATAPGAIPNHLAWAIVSTILATCLCCGLGLIGIVGIVYSSKVDTLLAQGDFAGAQRAADTAKVWCWVVTALAIVGVLGWSLVVASGGMAEYMEMMQQFQ